MAGGPSPIDTWDGMPDAPVEVMEPGVRLIDSLEAAVEEFGGDARENLTEAVDFENEKIVVVSLLLFGFGEPVRHETSEDGSQVTFYNAVHGPQRSDPPLRTFYFVVPREVEVELGEYRLLGRC